MKALSILKVGIWFFVLNGILCNAKAQEVLFKSRVDSIRMDAVNFLVDKGYLEKHRSLEEYKKRIYFFEIQTESILGYSKIGIFIFGVSTSNTNKFILTMDETGWKILNMEDLPSALREVSSFFIRNKISNDGVVKFIKGIIEVYEYNQRY
jgi:hypothetical protein